MSRRVLGVTLLFFAAFIGGCSSTVPVAVSETKAALDLNSLLDEIQTWEEARSPLAPLYRGVHLKSIAPLTFDDVERQLTAAQSYRDRLRAVDAKRLTGQQNLSLQVMMFKLNDLVDRLEFGEQLIPVNAEGGFYNSLSFIVKRLPFDTAADYQAFLAWLPDYADYLLSHLPRLKKGVEKGHIAPGPVIDNTLSMLGDLASLPFDEHPAMQPFAKLSSLDEAEQIALRESAERIFLEKLQPTYAKLRDYFAGEYAQHSPALPGISALPGGADYYRNRVEFFTTLPLSPDQVFALGEREVARISAEMQKVLRELGYVGSQADFIAELRRAPEHYPQSPQALLERAAWIAKRIEGQLPQLFDPLYELPFTIEPVPAEIAATYTSGRYVSGDPKQDRAGIYWVNTTRLKSRALFNLPALTLHEAVPGHHLQHALTAELDKVHPFRNKYYISAFGEGWGLYAEYLGEEMGIYQTAYERFGRLSYEMWRACRLVVDVGLHDRGWTRARAVDYLGRRTALSEHEVVTEIDRYIGWPGQALAYKLGELTILGLRREAEQELGAKFDIKAFHEAVLGSGALPLQLLISQVRLKLGLEGSGLPKSLL